MCKEAEKAIYSTGVSVYLLPKKSQECCREAVEQVAQASENLPTCSSTSTLGEYPTVKFQNAVTRELYEQENSTVKDEVKEYHDDPTTYLSPDEDGDDNDDDIDKAEVWRVDKAKNMLRLAQ